MQRVDEKQEIQRSGFVSRDLLAGRAVWLLLLTKPQPTVDFSQVANFHIKVSFVSIAFSFGKF